VSEAPHHGRRLIGLAAAALATAGLLGACGGDDDGSSPGEPVSEERWRSHAAGLCDAGTQEAVALPLPGNRREVAADARARAEILVNTRDQMMTLPPPEEIADEVDAYLGELDADIDLLSQTAEAARGDGDFRELINQMDESAGQAALELDLEECAAFANAIARTP
jgi:hypothetical protein